MRFVFNLLAMFAVALAIGLGLSYFALTDGRLFGAYRVGPWSAWPAVGAPAPDPYTQALIVRSGALQLGQAEGIQFTAHVDSAGEPLRRECAYAIAGRTPIAAFWTLVAQTPQGVNIARPDGQLTLHSARVARAPDGVATLYVSPRLAPQNWLETTGRGPLELVMTLYDTSVFAASGSTALTMPDIRNEGCA